MVLPSDKPLAVVRRERHALSEFPFEVRLVAAVSDDDALRRADLGADGFGEALRRFNGGLRVRVAESEKFLFPIMNRVHLLCRAK